MCYRNPLDAVLASKLVPVSNWGPALMPHPGTFNLFEVLPLLGCTNDLSGSGRHPFGLSYARIERVSTTEGRCNVLLNCLDRHNLAPVDMVNIA